MNVAIATSLIIRLFLRVEIHHFLDDINEIFRKVNVSENKLFLNYIFPKILKVRTYNLLNYKKQKYRQKYVLDKWYILSNLSSPEKIKKIYSQRMGIEAMFKDYKTGGYNLESAKANEIRLNNLILLIAISYTISFFSSPKS